MPAITQIGKKLKQEVENRPFVFLFTEYGKSIYGIYKTRFTIAENPTRQILLYLIVKTNRHNKYRALC